MKHTSVAAILLASLALALPSCGGGDEQSPAPAAGTNPATPAEQPRESAPPRAERTPAPDNKNGGGGSSAADAERAASSGDTGKAKQKAATPKPSRPGTSTKPAAKKPGTPEQQISTLPAAQRRKLERDLYRQGKELCYAYGPKELAKNYHFPSADPATIARLYARQYEAAVPALILPYQQGCLAGFKRFARNPPKQLTPP